MKILAEKLMSSGFEYDNLSKTEKKIFIDQLVDIVMRSKFYCLIKGKTLNVHTLMNFVKNYC